MENLEKLFSGSVNLKRQIPIRNKMFVYNLEKNQLDGKQIKKIIDFTNTVIHKYPKIKLPIYLNLGKITIADKLTYVLLECICNYIIEHCGRKVVLNLAVDNYIDTEGITSSPLFLLKDASEVAAKKYSEKFYLDIYKSHYRKVITMEENEDIYFLSLIMADIDTFLKPFVNSDKYRSAIAEVIIELAGNALEHAQSDCLIDLDISDEYRKENSNGEYYGINISIINFSAKLIGSSIIEKLKREELLNQRHNKLVHAFNKHRKDFSINYREEDFYNIATFQHKISGRLSNETTGGTGLTKLIKRMEDYSNAYHCYLISGERALSFLDKYLIFNEDGWIGFNDENDFLNSSPDQRIFGKSHIKMPGTAYNLNFIMKKDESMII